MVEYTDEGKFAWFNGLKFTRDDKTGYYLNATHRIRLHRVVWQATNGDIPENHHIHHIDHDHNNNEPENLVAMLNAKHCKLTGQEQTQEQREWFRKNLAEKARPKASAWHGSPEGLAWHTEHGKRVFADLPERELQCLNCGILYKTKKRSNSKFCSNACKSAWRRKIGADNITVQCVYCHTDFITSKIKPSATCSRACANRYFKYGKRVYKNSED
jgi:hypothetical protein